MPLGAVPAPDPSAALREQLQEMGHLNPSVEILDAQSKMRKDAREAKAEKMLAKSFLTALSL